MENLRNDEQVVDDTYDDFLDVCRAQCHCCPDCSEHPCAGVMQGGVCNNLRCECSDDDYVM